MSKPKFENRKAKIRKKENGKEKLENRPLFSISVF